MENSIQSVIDLTKRGLIDQEEKNFMIASTIYITYEKYATSKELAEVYAGYDRSELDRHLKVAKKSDFICAYVIPVDPEKNYGRSFKLYLRYIADGIQFIKECTAGSMISSAPLREVVAFPDGFVLTNRGYKKTEEAREFLRKNRDHITVM